MKPAGCKVAQVKTIQQFCCMCEIYKNITGKFSGIHDNPTTVNMWRATCWCYGKIWINKDMNRYKHNVSDDPYSLT